MNFFDDNHSQLKMCCGATTTWFPGEEGAGLNLIEYIKRRKGEDILSGTRMIMGSQIIGQEEMISRLSSELLFIHSIIHSFYCSKSLRYLNAELQPRT